MKVQRQQSIKQIRNMLRTKQTGLQEILEKFGGIENGDMRMSDTTQVALDYLEQCIDVLDEVVNTQDDFDEDRDLKQECLSDVFKGGPGGLNGRRMDDGSHELLGTLKTRLGDYNG
jgi:hypothetical protein